MSENKTYPVFENIARKSHIQKKNYEQMYLRSIEEPDAFWAEQAEQFISWFAKWDKCRIVILRLQKLLGLKEQSSMYVITV